MSYTLRPYQSVILEKARGLMQSGHRDILIQAPTGSGKTMLTAHMLKTAASKGMRSLFIVHRRELIKQSVEAFTNVGVPHGVIAAGFEPNYLELIQIASIQTLKNRLHLITEPRLIIFDECHHISSGSWDKVYSTYKQTAFNIGLTATPQRLDGVGLQRWFTEMIHGPSVRWLIDNKFLSPYKIFAPPIGISVHGIKKTMGDYDKGELNTAVNKPSITGDAVLEYRKRCAGKRAVVFCINVSHSESVVQAFNEQGIPALHVDANTPKEIRDRSIEQFRRGEVLILSNVDIFGEGFDLPAIEAVILLRPTQSLGLHLQQVGRALRPSPNKEYAIILDHVGNYERHGLPCDEREWSLTDRKKRKTEKDLSIKTCPKCFAVLHFTVTGCSECGYTFQAKLNKREIIEIDSELIEIDPLAARINKKKEQSKATDLNSLLKLGIDRGYKNPRMWAQHIIQGRKKYAYR